MPELNLELRLVEFSVEDQKIGKLTWKIGPLLPGFAAGTHVSSNGGTSVSSNKEIRVPFFIRQGGW